MLWKIARIGKDEVVSFAASELKKYMSQIDPSREYVILLYKKYDPSLTDVLWVGEDASFPLPEVSDTARDDAISIDVHGNAGYITGTNPRSVLIAAYRFLRELGCAFVRPGIDGEVIPSYELGDVDVSVFEAASYRHRAICIEGAVSEDHVVDTIDWMPKVGMNGYFNQFRVPFEFYDRWYSHKRNPLYEKENFTLKDAEGIMFQTIDEMKKRGMLYHAAGHGWTCDPFGIEGSGWVAKDYDIPEKTKEIFALVNGKRELWHGVPLNTNLCYSNQYVKETMANAIADYCIEIPEVDYLHVWLADGSNNHCECENCKDRRPADFYVDLLNRIDEVMTAKGVDTKIVFLIYVDLLWEPIESRLKNQDRFVLMYAPITRTYTESMTEAKDFDPEKLSPYVKNKVIFPADVGENIARLRKWQAQFDGDSFVFDYHFMWDHFKDPGYFKHAKVLFDDMANLDKFGLNGMVSCQNQRVFFPTGLGMIAMAEALWNKNTDFDAMAKDYFMKAFGDDGLAVMEYMSTLSDLFDPPYLRAEREVISAESAEKFAEIPVVIDEFSDVIARNIAAGEAGELDPAQLSSWDILTYHAELCKLIAKMLEYIARDDFDKATEMKEVVYSYARMHESELHDVFDVNLFISTFERHIIGKILKKLNR